MTSSQTPSRESTSAEIPTSDISYYQQRLRNRVFEAVLSFFEQRAEKNGLTKKELAERLGKDPSQITRWFSGPGNWTLDTISDLLLAMEAELELKARAFEDLPIQNYAHPLAIEHQSGNLGVPHWFTEHGEPDLDSGAKRPSIIDLAAVE